MQAIRRSRMFPAHHALGDVGRSRMKTASHTEGTAPPVAKLDAREKYILALWLIRAYLCADPEEAAMHVAWIQYRSGLNDAAFAPADREARESAAGWRAANRIDQAREM